MNHTARQVPRNPCPWCGMQPEPEDKFCGQCGASFKTTDNEQLRTTQSRVHRRKRLGLYYEEPVAPPIPIVLQPVANPPGRVRRRLGHR